MMKCAIAGWLMLLAFSAARAGELKCTDEFIGDIYYLADSSNSINGIGWGRCLAFIVNITNQLPLGPKNVQVALGIFSSRFKHLISLNQITNHADFERAVLNTTHMKENTATYKALEDIKEQGLLTAPENGGRSGVPKITIVITDGQSQNVTKTIYAAEQLKKDNITIFAVGVGVTNNVELIGIAGDERNVFNVKSYGAIESIKQQLTQRICDAPTEPPVPHCPEQIKNDIVFVVDSSGSIGATDYAKNWDFILQFIMSLTIGKNSTCVALVIFGTHPYVILNLTCSRDLIIQALLNVPFRNSSTHTDAALRRGLELFKAQGREGANETIVLVTDGKSTYPEKTLVAAAEVKDAGVNIFCLGVKPDADEDELRAVASIPEYSVAVQNYTMLIKYATNISQQACHAKPPPPPVKPCPQATIIDMFIVVDSSGSIGEDRFHFNADFLSRLFGGFILSEIGIKIALATYGTSVKQQWGLSSNKTYILEKLKNIPYQNSSTNTHLALLWVARSGVNTVEQGARPNATKMVFILTDGKSGKPNETQNAADELKSAGIDIFVLAIGKDADLTEIRAIASRPEFVIECENYESLIYYASKTSDVLCNGGPR